MTSPEKSKKVARPWFQYALNDLKAAKFLMTGEEKFLKRVCYDCQQVVEKTLKGFLVFHGKKVVHTHNIREIAKEILKIDPSLEALLLEGANLTPYVVAYRYPDATTTMKDPTVEETEAILKLAERIFQEITSQIPSAGPLE